VRQPSIFNPGTEEIEEPKGHALDFVFKVVSALVVAKLIILQRANQLPA
jgi:hypothetical protein